MPNFWALAGATPTTGVPLPTAFGGGAVVGAALPALTQLLRLMGLGRALDDVIQPDLPAEEEQNKNSRRDQQFAEDADDAHPVPLLRNWLGARSRGVRPVPANAHRHDCKRRRPPACCAVIRLLDASKAIHATIVFHGPSNKHQASPIH